ncbi:MAG: hypothetical protein FDW93_07355 [Bergeyella sp.]|nr:hypothetical protein [Bergeyella sp.]
MVKTSSGQVVMIHRKMPYCFQNYLIQLLKNKRIEPPFDLEKISVLQDEFENHIYPTLHPNLQDDYDRYKAKLAYEDEWDFPHGQMDKRRFKKDDDPRFKWFRVAYQEFEEESGYRFAYQPSDVAQYPLIKLEFTGLDQCIYTQYFFIVEHPKHLRRNTYFDNYSPFQSQAAYRMALERNIGSIDDRMVYRGYLIKIEEALKYLTRQQEMKKDGKDQVLLYFLEGDKWNPPDSICYLEK